jgi:hypothetical protein
MNWKIEPYESVGAIKFGMSHTEVERVLGPAEDSQSNPIPESASVELREKYKDDLIEFRIGTGPETTKPSVQYRQGKVVSLELYDFLKGVEIKGFRPFEHSKLKCIDMLTEMSKSYAEDGEDYIFLDLGLAMSADEEWEYAPSINVFALGQFDDIVARGVASGDMKIVKK